MHTPEALNTNLARTLLKRRHSFQGNEEDVLAVAKGIVTIRGMFRTSADPEVRELFHKYDKYLDDAIIGRFFLAMKKHVPDTYEKLLAHVRWRQEFKTDTIIFDDFSKFTERRELYWGGKDKDNRWTIIFRFCRHNADQDNLEYARCLVHQVEMGRHVLNIDSINIIFDVNEATNGQFSVDLVKVLVSTLQHNYPERVNRIYIFPMSTMQRMIVNVVKAFMDPNTAQKMILLTSSDFKQRLSQDFEKNQLEIPDGGIIPKFDPVVLPMPKPASPPPKPESSSHIRPTSMLVPPMKPSTATSEPQSQTSRERRDIRKQVKLFFANFKAKHGRDPTDVELSQSAELKALFLKAKMLESAPQ